MALSRYKNNARIRYDRQDKFHQAIPVFVPGAELAQAVSFIIVDYVEGTRLDSLAYKYLGNGRYWWAICMMNDLNSPYDPHLIVGSKLRIPQNIRELINYIHNKA